MNTKDELIRYYQNTELSPFELEAAESVPFYVDDRDIRQIFDAIMRTRIQMEPK